MVQFVRILILSDIHGNLEALEAVLKNQKYSELVVLGDLVGYGANPNEVVETIRSLKPLAVIRGNHDKVASGVSSGENFNASALSAIQWAHQQLTPDNLDYLRNLPTGPLSPQETMTIAHGSPYDEEEYIFQEWVALRSFQYFHTPICFYGHSHVPIVVTPKGENDLHIVFPKGSETIPLDLRTFPKYLINAGSVGQPRDCDPRSCSLILDLEKMAVEFHRLDYDIVAAQEKILQANLPAYLAERLAFGR